MDTVWAILSWLWSAAGDAGLRPPIVVAILAGMLYLYVKLSDGMTVTFADGFHDTSRDSHHHSLWPKYAVRDLAAHERKHETKAKQFGGNGYWFYTAKGAEFQRTNCGHLTGVQHAAISLAPGEDCSAQDKANAKWYIEHYYPKEEYHQRMTEAKRLAR